VCVCVCVCVCGWVGGWVDVGVDVCVWMCARLCIRPFVPRLEHCRQRTPVGNALPSSGTSLKLTTETYR
jgi:hypothetical protein